MDHPGIIFTRPNLLRNARILSPGVIEEEISVCALEAVCEVIAPKEKRKGKKGW